MALVNRVRDMLAFTHIARNPRNAYDETKTEVSYSELVRRVKASMAENDKTYRFGFGDDKHVLFTPDGCTAVKMWIGLVDANEHSLNDDLAFLTIFEYKLAEDKFWDCTRINHYIPIDWAADIVTASEHRAKLEIENIIKQQVERGVSAGVEKAVTQQVKTLAQVQTERERLEAQLAELKATEARMIETERRQQERDERLQQRQAEKAAQRQTRNRAGYVYVARGEYGGQVAYKIGRSVNPNSRAKTFGVQLPFSVEFVALIQSEDMYALESELHRHYDQQGKWLAGEWFNLEANDIEYIKSLGNAA